MPFHDLLLCPLTYPDATSDRAIGAGLALARRLGERCAIMALKVDLPAIGNRFANLVMDFDRLAREQEAQSAKAAERALDVARTAAENAGVEVETNALSTRLYEEADAVCTAARTRDLSLHAVGPATLAARGLAEAALFGSGRPILVFPEVCDVSADDHFGSVVVAWDGGAKSARAAADALPILQAAGGVRIVTLTGEPAKAAAAGVDAFARHLERHGVIAEVDEIRLGERSAAQELRANLAARPADLLVMGGYGHARIREFVLGGVTASMLDAPPCPVLMSH